jgi:hypothetical protein
MSTSSPTCWTAEDWARYGKHAAPEAIGVVLADLRAEITARQKAADRLETLLAHRQREVATGAWPPPLVISDEQEARWRG